MSEFTALFWIPMVYMAVFYLILRNWDIQEKKRIWLFVVFVFFYAVGYTEGIQACLFPEYELKIVTLIAIGSTLGVFAAQGAIHLNKYLQRHLWNRLSERQQRNIFLLFLGLSLLILLFGGLYIIWKAIEMMIKVL